VADGYVRFESDGQGGTVVIVDPDGRAAGHPWGDYVVDLEHVSPDGLTSAQLFGGTGGPAVPGSGGSGQVLTSTRAGDFLVGGSGADTLNAGWGPDTLIGGGGADRFAFALAPWAPVHITDFTPGQDVIDLKGLPGAIGYSGSDPFADRYLSLIPDGAGGTAVLFDRDGVATGQLWPDYVIDIEHVAPESLTSSSWILH
jgi:hypothetical protein